MGKIKKRAGFTLIEVIIAIFILIVIIVGVLMLLSSSYASLRESEVKNIAKNIGTYTVEYIRSRNVTVDNMLNHSSSELGNDNTYNFPGLEDLRKLEDLRNQPLQSNGDSSKTININPVLPSVKFSGNSLAFYYSLQGYVSLGLPDANVEKDINEDYRCVDVSSYNGGVHTSNYLLVALPNLSDPVKNFSAGSTYIPMIYTTDPNKFNPAKPEYDPHYTNNASDKPKTMDYNGFRVLTSIAARKKDPSDTHVQYFDVKVTVLWVTGGDEHEYSLATQIVTY
jgi:type II secretory pathway pseudopilin PulG